MCGLQVMVELKVTRMEKVRDRRGSVVVDTAGKAEMEEVEETIYQAVTIKAGVRATHSALPTPRTFPSAHC